MKKASTRTWFAGAPLLCATIPLVCIPVADWLAVSSHGNSGFLDLSLLFVFVALAAFIAFIVSLVGLIFIRIRRFSALLALCSAAYLVALFVSMRVGEYIRMNAFHQLAERSQPLVGAIHAFEQRHKHPPESLRALVPEFIPSIPNTGMAAYPEYDYLTPATNWDGNSWVLRVPTSLGVLNWDQFIYFPLTNYPASGYGGSLERVEDWAYVHE